MINTEQSSIQECGLTRIAARARSHREEQFTSLLHHLTPQLLENNIRAIPARTAVGTDGLSRDVILQNLNWLGRRALAEIFQGTYQVPAVRRVLIPKKDDGQRQLGIPTILDRGLQSSVAKVLGSIYEEDFLNSSFGFRANRGCHNAIATLQNSIYYEEYRYALEVDIRDFFGSLDHSWLRKFLRHRVGDGRVLKLIDSWLQGGVLVEGKQIKAIKGTVQGGSISPLLGNIYLHYALDLWFEKVAKKHLRNGARLIRYCDDFVIVFKDPKDREDFLPLLKARLQQFNLEISEKKTHFSDVIPPGRPRKVKRRGIRFVGFCMYWTKSWSGKAARLVIVTESGRLAKAKTALTELLAKVMHLELSKQVQAINWFLRGHYNYYGMPGNNFKLGIIDNHLMRTWRQMLSNRGEGRLTWDKFHALTDRYKLARPMLKVTYKTLSAYAML